MKKYVTFVEDKDESRQVQEALFKAGFKWCSGDGFVKSYNDCFFVLNDDPMTFFYRHPSELFDINTCPDTKAVVSDLVFISAQDIIAGPFQLDGAKQPEKMIAVKGKDYTESRLAELVRAAEELES